MSGFLLPIVNGPQFFDNAGKPLAGGLISIYTAGTTTPVTTYTGSALSVANPNPLVLDAYGRLTSEAWVPSGTVVKIVITDKNSNPLGFTFDNVAAINDFITTVSQVFWAGTSTGTTNSISLTQGTGPNSLTSGQLFLFVASNSNTGATVANPYGLGSFPVDKANSQALVGGEILAGRLYGLLFNANTFQLMQLDTWVANQVAIASAASVNVASAGSRYLSVTGTTGISAMSVNNGDWAELVFAGTCTLTNGAGFVLPGGNNIVTAPGDTARVQGEATLTRVVRYTQNQRIPASPGGGLLRRTYFTGVGTSTWTSTGDAFAIEVEVQGGGAAGPQAYSTGSNGTVTSGGNAGAYAKWRAFTSLVNANQNVIVGSGGATSTATTFSTLANGGPSAFGTFLTCGGGVSGTASALNSATPNVCNPITTQAVATGSFQYTVPGAIGGAGLGAASVTLSGQGGSTPLGVGGNGGAAAAPNNPGYQVGIAAVGYGAGGGGAASVGTFTTSIPAGGSGAPGIVIVTEYT